MFKTYINWQEKFIIITAMFISVYSVYYVDEELFLHLSNPWVTMAECWNQAIPWTIANFSTMSFLMN